MFLLRSKSFFKRSHLKNVSLFFIILSSAMLISLVNTKTQEDEININKSEANRESCKSDESRISSTLLVGLLSSLVFCFIGILPAFFIRTDKDEEMFSKYFFYFFMF